MARTVVIAGVGPGLGESIARKFADEGCAVELFARSEEDIDELAADLESTAGDGLAVPMDTADRSQVEDGFETSSVPSIP